jgi:hypothetical protein
MDDYRVQELERELRAAQRTISRIQGAMRTAARYEASPSEGEDEILVLKRQLAGMQAALLKGAEESFRPHGRKSR